MFRVDRSLLLLWISERTKKESVVLTGSPGAGKSWIIAQFVRSCRSTKRPNLALSAEDFEVRSIAELTHALGLKTDLITLLANLGSGAVLIIDGLDALRSNVSQRTFRELIRRVSVELPGCAVLTSIRTFDLQQSTELQRLFFAPTTTVARPFTEIGVGAFTPEELRHVSEQVPEFEYLFHQDSGEFHELLRNPFNLHLCVLLLLRGFPWKDLSVAQSQTQLMDIYWASRINHPSYGQDARALLRSLLRRMVDGHALSLSQDGADTLGPTWLLELLKSEEVLRVSSTGRLSFAHNILFDYAIARLLLDENSLLSFLTEDPSRSIFFRPSVSFFFHHLWLTDRSLFWNVVSKIFASASIPERVRIVAAAAIYDAATEPNDLDPLFQLTADISSTGLTSLLRAVQAFGGLQSRKRTLWLDLLNRVSEKPSVQSINEQVGLLSAASDSTEAEEQNLIAQTSRRLLRWMWDQSSALSPAGAADLADFGSGRILPVALRFYSSDREASRHLVLEMLDRLELPTAGPHEAFRLAHEIGNIVRDDPAVGIEVYRRLFGHEEKSEASSLIGGPVFQMRSTRRQDFSLALYALQSEFPNYVRRAPLEAAVAAIESVNAEVPRERRIPPDGEKFSFRFMGDEARYVSDYSEIWDSGGQDYLSLSILDAALNHAAQLLETDATRSNGIAIVRTIAKRNIYAVGWKRLLQATRRNPAPLHSLALELLSTPLLLSAPETTVDAGEVIKAIYGESLVDGASATAIEQAIADIPGAAIIGRYEKPLSIRNRLLMCIPSDRLRSNELKDLASSLSSTQAAAENRPYHHTSFEWLSREQALRLQGLDTTTPENAGLLEALKPLESFERKFLNEVPDLDECAKIGRSIEQITPILMDFDGPEELSTRARGALCAVAETILKNPSLPKGEALWSICRSILLQGALDPSPRFNPEYHLSFDRPSWGGQSPRIEATQGLGHLIWSWGLDLDAVEALKLLSQDLVPAVRFQVPSAILGLYKRDAHDEFWTLVEAMIENEPTPGVMIGLVHVLGQVAGTDPRRVSGLLSRVIERGFIFSEQHELIEQTVGILLWLYIGRDEAKANDQLQLFEDDASLYHRALAQEVFATTAYFRLGNSAERAGFRKARTVVERILAAVYRAQVAALAEPVTEARGEKLRNLFSVLKNAAFHITQLLKDTTAKPDDDKSIGRELYFELKPVLELLASPPVQPNMPYLLPETAHHLMEAFNSVLDYDPHTILKYAASVCKAGTAPGYAFDPMAMTESVKFAERVLADHRDTLGRTETATALGDVLDSFVKAGWPEAVRLAFKLDEAVR